MNQAVQSLTVLGITSVLVSFLAHFYFRSYVLVSFISAVISSALFQVFAYFQLGHLDPFFLIAFVVTLIPTLIVSLIIGFVFKKKRACTNGAA